MAGVPAGLRRLNGVDVNRNRILSAVLVTATLAATGLAVAAWRDHAAAADREHTGQTCLAGATAAAQAIFSYDYRSFDASVANGRAFTTGSFTDEYTETTTSLKPVAEQQQAVVRAEVSAAGLIEARANEVDLLLYVNQYRRNVAITGEKVDQNRVVLTMTLDGGVCKVVKAAAI